MSVFFQKQISGFIVGNETEGVTLASDKTTL